MTKATRRITKLRVNELSLVGEGDNPHADVLILKHRQAVGIDLDVVKQNLQAVRKSALALASELSEEGVDMDINEMTERLDTIEKSLGEAQKQNETLTGQVTDLTGQLENVTKERDAALAAVEKAKPAQSEEDVLKSLPEPVRNMVEKARKDAADALAEVEKTRAEREEGEEIEKARAAGHSDPDTFGKLVHRVRKGKSTPEDADALLDLITKAAALAKGGEKLFKAIGKAKGEEVNDAQVKLDEAITNIQKAKPSLTREQAYAEALDANPALYEEVRKAKSADA